MQSHAKDLLVVDANGLFCPRGGFYVDPWRPVERAVVTHGHADHARPGSKSYLTAASGAAILKQRLGLAAVEGLPFGEVITMNGVKVSLHPAGHILGSAQVRVEHADEVWVVTGDYKTEDDRTTETFELVRCDTLVTECTFGLPIYRWAPAGRVFGEINDWWRSNRARGVTSVLLGYALGKAQRLIVGLDASIGPIYTHGAVERLNAVYRRAGRLDVPTSYASSAAGGTRWSDGIVIAPPSAGGSTWLRRFGDVSVGFASGWMAIRGRRRQRGADRGFVLSDHVDWPGLLDVIRSTGCRRVLATHGYTEALCRWLNERGLDAEPLRTRYEGEDYVEPGEGDAYDESGEAEDHEEPGEAESHDKPGDTTESE